MMERFCWVDKLAHPIFSYLERHLVDAQAYPYGSFFTDRYIVANLLLEGLYIGLRTPEN